MVEVGVEAVGAVHRWDSRWCRHLEWSLGGADVGVAVVVTSDLQGYSSRLVGCSAQTMVLHHPSAHARPARLLPQILVASV